MEEEKIVGITCDNYKIEKFKAELTAKGFTNFEVKLLRENLSIIKVCCFPKEYPAIAKICKAVEAYFLSMKN